MTSKHLTIVLISLISIAPLNPAIGQDEIYGSGKNLAFNFYQKHISPVNGKSCPMHPSCSQYAKIVLAEKPALEAYLLIMERLQLCGQDIRGNYTLVNLGGHRLAYDPVDWRTNPYLSPVDIDHIIPVSLDLSHSFPLADSLFLTANLGTALLEYQRLFLRSEQNVEVQMILGKRIAKVYYRMGDIEKLLALFELKFERWPAQQDISDLFNMLIAKHHFKNSDFNKAKTSLSLMSGDPTLEDSKTLLHALCDFYQDNWEQGLLRINQINDVSYQPFVNNFLTMQPQYEKLKLRNPASAALFSTLVPGSGFLLSKKPGTAITAFIINGLFISLTYESIRKENYALASVSGFFGLGWYIGSIRASSKSVKKRNKKKKLDFLSSILNHHNSSNL